MGCVRSKTSKPERAGTVSVNAGTFVVANRTGLPPEFQVIKSLGEGAFAQVKLCVHSRIQQQRAVKFIHKAGLNAQQKDPQNFLQEVKVLKALEHPNILRCYEIYEDARKYYVVTEFCEGGELFDRIIAMKRFDEAKAAQIMFQLLSAVAYCHEQHVIHRDLKPENILLEEGESLNIKIADFGSSRFLDPKQQLTGCFGSAYYVAPEVLNGTYNEKCDVWSCGVILFILLTGRPPYPGSNESAILQMVRTNPLQISPELLPNLSEGAVSVLQGMLHIDPAKRLSARAALEHPWVQTCRNNQEAPDLSETLNNLNAFNSSTKLKEAVHVYLATQVISREDLRLLKESFQALDKNGDGKISQTELMEEWAKTMSKEEAKSTVDAIMSRVDADGSGDINYSEFLTACMNYEKYMSTENLQMAFKLFDKDGSGDITAEELRNTLSGGVVYEDEVWKRIIAEVDQNGDGKIDLKEFLSLMTQYNTQTN